MIKSFVTSILFCNCLMLSACGPARAPEPATLAISPAFDAASVKAILTAVDAWQDATHNQTGLNVLIGTEADIYIHPAPINGIAAGATYNSGNDDYMDISVDLELIAVIALRANIDRFDWLTDTAEHEMGHAFGLEHESGTLMQSAGYWGTTIDKKTLAQFHRING